MATESTPKPADVRPTETVHLCCTPFLTWCHENAGRLVTTKSPATFFALPIRCGDCARLYRQWLNS